MDEIIYAFGIIFGTIVILIAYNFLGLVFFYLGWPFVKLFTFGKYQLESNVLNVFKQGTRESAYVGIVVLALIIIIFFMT